MTRYPLDMIALFQDPDSVKIDKTEICILLLRGSGQCKKGAHQGAWMIEM